MKYIYILFAFILYSMGYAQGGDYINTDRPDQSEGVYTLAQKMFQIENGVTFSEGSFANDLMLRYGLFQTTEIRLSSDFEKNKRERFQISNIGFSFKQRVVNQKDILPAITLVGYLNYENPIKRWSTDFYVAFENELSDKFLICYNVGTSNFLTEMNVTMQFGYSITNQIYTFLEYYATFSNQLPLHNFDGGILYCITPDFQVDACVGYAVFRKDNDWFTAMGFSYRFF